MKNYLFLLLLFSSGLLVAQSFPIVREGKPNVTIVNPEKSNRLRKLAIADFINTVKIATGAVLPQVDEKDIENLSPSSLKLVFGPSPLTSKILGSNPNLEPEQFRIITKGNYLLVLANDILRGMETRNSMTTSYALSHLMESYMGVKWLWPGELGTYAPFTKNISIPNQDYTYQPQLVKRRFNLPTKQDEILVWASHHKASGERVNYNFMHSFRKIGMNGDWWGDFKDTKPHMLAQNPSGKPEMGSKPDFYQICTTHPDSRAEVIKRWEAAGMPEFWDLTANDGNGFCTCDLCMDLDEKLGGYRHTKEEVFNYQIKEINLTERHVDFWNDIITRMREKRKDAKILVFLYGRYRTPPKNMKVAPGVLGELVHGYDFSLWHEWTKAGIYGIGLRPNWWHMGANAPHLPLHIVADYMNKAHQNKMTHLFMDSMLEYWANQGPFYYLVARMADNKNLNADIIIDEYASAFGKGAPEIKNYIKYWEDYHDEVDYNIPAGGILTVNNQGLYEKVCKEQFKVSQHPLSGHWKTLPFIYTPEIIVNSERILDKAVKKAKKDTLALKRIEFLRDGLRHLEMTSNYMKADKDTRKTIANELVDFDKKMKEKHGYWHTKELQMLKEWGLLDKEFNVNDM
ncbi:MAG: DUF4838 domain-containing protein [Leadbetterella sp.]